MIIPLLLLAQLEILSKVALLILLLLWVHPHLFIMLLNEKADPGQNWRLRSNVSYNSLLGTCTLNLLSYPTQYCDSSLFNYCIK